MTFFLICYYKPIENNVDFPILLEIAGLRLNITHWNKSTYHVSCFQLFLTVCDKNDLAKKKLNKGNKNPYHNGWINGNCWITALETRQILGCVYWNKQKLFKSYRTYDLLACVIFLYFNVGLYLDFKYFFCYTLWFPPERRKQQSVGRWRSVLR